MNWISENNILNLISSGIRDKLRYKNDIADNGFSYPPGLMLFW